MTIRRRTDLWDLPRAHEPLPAPGATTVLAVGVVLAGTLLLVATLW
ncbi:MAG: hypothetical protein ABR500_07440 [Dermatophilaceae bacterium]|nr:hypothetical protein [Intrasporangiaceae bacterium]